MSEWQPTPPGGADASRSLQHALGLHRQGRVGEAENIYNDVLRAQPRNIDALHLLGLLKFQQNKAAEAERLIATALTIEPNSAVLLSNYGRVQEALGRHADALTSYDKALAFNPGDADALFNRGNVLQALNRPAEAVVSYQRTLALHPAHIGAHYNSGIALQTLNRPTDSLASLEKALALNPTYADAFNNRGNVLATLGRYDDALASFDRCIALAPGHVLAFYNRGLALKTMDRPGEAQRSLERALALKPDYAEARFALCMAQLPPLYAAPDEIDRQRAAYREQLDSLWEVAERTGRFDSLAPGVGASQPFYLPYQGHNDRDLQARYGGLVCRIMAARFPAATLPPKPLPAEPVRVGFVSGFFRNHANWRIPIKGWLAGLDRRSFKVFGYHTASQVDSETNVASGLCERFVQGPKSLDEWRREIACDAPHVLIYPELGMDPVCAPLAAQRLAPVQCNSLGHPVTSGFPTIDYFLSSALMEPLDAQAHYTESLIELPNLSIYYEPAEIQPAAATRPDFGIRSEASVYWCGQSLYKYLPQFDEVFPRIALDVAGCQFVFLEFQAGGNTTDLFRKRLERAFAAHGLRADHHCIVLKRLSQPEFLAVSGLCDNVLDSIGWSGFNSTLECLAQDLPVVTMAGPMMRGRHSAAILQMMEVTDTVTHSLDDYVATAVRLSKDVSWRTVIKSRIAANKHKLYRDTACIDALAAFLNRAAR